MVEAAALENVSRFVRGVGKINAFAIPENTVSGEIQMSDWVECTAIEWVARIAKEKDTQKHQEHQYPLYNLQTIEFNMKEQGNRKVQLSERIIITL